MNFNRRTVTARSGMSQEEALIGLQNHPKFKKGSVIAGIRRRGDRWVISLFEPKSEGDDKGIDMDLDAPKDDKPKDDKDFPELDKGDSDDNKDDDKDDNKDDKSDDKSKDKGDSKNSLEDKINRLEKLLNKVVDALGLSEPAEHKAPGMVDDMMMPPAPAPAPAPKPKPGGNTKEVVLNKSMKPGEAPPGTLPAGAPTFASTKVASFTASSPDVFSSVKEAKDSLDREFAEHGYVVKQIRREDGQVHALLALR